MEPTTTDLVKLAQKNSTEIAALGKSLGTITERLSKTRASGHSPNQVFGTPHVREGEDPFSSRGFSFMKMIGMITGACSKNDAKVELDIHNRMQNAYCNEMGPVGYQMTGGGQDGVAGGRFLAPLSTAYMQESVISPSFRQEIKALTNAGMSGADPDEMMWIRTKMLGRTKALSWLNELTGGALVAPEMGELIELLRNKEALVNAGARTVPLPAQGRMKYPRQTAASLTYWIGESSPITDSTPGTGEITLQAKKLAVLIKAPNELIRFASPAAEALMRDDMTKSLALGLDLAALEGNGGDNRPLGIIQRQNINRITSSAPGAGNNGDAVVGQDIYRFLAAVEESNAEFQSFIMRPKTVYKFYQLRLDAVAQGDKAGPFLFNLIREAGDNSPATLAGHKVIKSTQVSQVRSKSTAAGNLTYILGGMFSDVLIGMFGGIEFAQTAQGDTSFVNDQTWVRGILSADVQVRHEAALVLMDNLDTTI